MKTLNQLVFVIVDAREEEVNGNFAIYQNHGDVLLSSANLDFNISDTPVSRAREKLFRDD